MGPKLEDQLGDLTALVGQFITATSAAIEQTNKKVEELTDAVDTLTDQLKDEATRQTTSSARASRTSVFGDALAGAPHKLHLRAVLGCFLGQCGPKGLACSWNSPVFSPGPVLADE